MNSLSVILKKVVPCHYCSLLKHFIIPLLMISDRLSVQILPLSPHLAFSFYLQLLAFIELSLKLDIERNLGFPIHLLFRKIRSHELDCRIPFISWYRSLFTAGVSKRPLSNVLVSVSRPVKCFSFLKDKSLYPLSLLYNAVIFFFLKSLDKRSRIDTLFFFLFQCFLSLLTVIVPCLYMILT